MLSTHKSPNQPDLSPFILYWSGQMPPGGTKLQPGPCQNGIKQLHPCNFRPARNNTKLVFCVIKFFDLHLSPKAEFYLTPTRLRSHFNTLILLYVKIKSNYITYANIIYMHIIYMHIVLYLNVYHDYPLNKIINYDSI